MVVDADDVLDQARKGKGCRIYSRAARLLSLRIREFFKDLIDRELQFLARSFEREVRLQAKVNIESMKDFG
jgi:hypothetical protein